MASQEKWDAIDASQYAQRCMMIRSNPGASGIANLSKGPRVCPSVIERLKKHFPDARFVLAAHPEEIARERPGDPRWIHRGKESLKILVLGALNPTKGPDLLEACALDASTRGLPLEFHLMGSAYRSLITRPDSALTDHGPYQDTDLNNLMTTLSPHLVWFPARWPETFSYTLSATFRQGLPVVAPDFGAFHDRLAGRPLSWLIPWDSKPSALNDLFVLLRGDVSAGRQFLVQKSVPPGNFSYETDYLVIGDRIRLGSPLMDPRFQKYTRPWRISKEYVRDYCMYLAHRILRSIYKLPGVRRTITSLMPEHRVQLIRRRLGKY